MRQPCSAAVGVVTPYRFLLRPRSVPGLPEGEVVKNRMHFDVNASGGRKVPMETRRARVDAAADRLVAAGATRVRAPLEEGEVDHYFVAMLDPEGNEFDVN